MSQAQTAGSVLDVMYAISHKFAERPALCIKSGDTWRELTYGEMSKRAIRLSSYLMENGIEQGDRIAILSESKPEWGVALFSSIRSGALTVPLDIKLTEAELTSILSDCRPKAIFADAKHLDMVEKIQQNVDSIKHIFCVDAESNGKHPSIDALEPKQLADSRERRADEVALIVYTSGTTGNPKGVMTTFANLMFQVNSFEDMIGLNASDRFLSILPLNHLYELTGGFLGVLNQGGMICFCHSLFPQEIVKIMREREITGMIAVPLFYKSLKGSIEREIRKKGDDAVAKFNGALAKAPSLSMEERAKMFAAVHEQLGGKVRVFISGGAPLDSDVAEFFNNMGIPLLQGYGLTETSPVISGNMIRANKIGSVGQALPGVELAIAGADPSDSSGEIITRGPHIMKGYYRRDDLTNEVIDKDGWFHTGDIGHLDDDKFLFITGRIKNLIVLGGGKKVFPEEVETALATAPCAKELCVTSRKMSDGFKEGTEEVCVIVVPSDAVQSQCKDQPQMLPQAVKKDIDELAQNLAPYKRPTKIFIFDGPEFPKTATRKVKRPLVNEWLKAQKD